MGVNGIFKRVFGAFLKFASSNVLNPCDNLATWIEGWGVGTLTFWIGGNDIATISCRR